MRVCIKYQCCVYVVYSVAVGPPHGLLAWSSEVNDSQFGWIDTPPRSAPDSSFPTLLWSGLTCDTILVNYMYVYMRCHGSYMSLFDAWVSAVAMFNLGQINAFNEASLIGHVTWQFCLFIINLCCKSSPWCPEQCWQKMGTTLDQYAWH